MTPGVYAKNNPENLYTAMQEELPDSNPRKYERLYETGKPDYYFGMELEATFVQTPSGLDSWGHDIIYEFTGDDDFWLYVDGELVMDLGGIHSAVAGSVNYSTGDVVVNGVHTTLYDIFRENYSNRYWYFRIREWPLSVQRSYHSYYEGILYGKRWWCF